MSAPRRRIRLPCTRKVERACTSCTTGKRYLVSCMSTDGQRRAPRQLNSSSIIAVRLISGARQSPIGQRQSNILSKQLEYTRIHLSEPERNSCLFRQMYLYLITAPSFSFTRDNMTRSLQILLTIYLFFYITN